MARRGSGAPRPAPWTDDDTCLWHTLDILAAVVTGRPERRSAVLTTFPPRLGADERLLVEGPMTLHGLTTLGDGTYQHSTTLLTGTGRVGVGLAVGSLAASAIGNASRRRAAAAAATPMWRPIDRGGLVVSTDGFYLHTAQGLFAWPWASVASAAVTGRRQVHVQGTAAHGRDVSWVLESCWSEVLFAVWALACHRTHPQLVDGTWLPPGWVDHARAHGYWPEHRVRDLTAALGASST